MRRPVAVCLLAVLLGAAGALTVAGDQRPKSPPVDTITVGPNDDRLWPYTSRSTAFEERTLALNVIVMSDPKSVRRLFARQPEVEVVEEEWDTQPAPADSPFAGTQVPSEWRSAHGSMRYTYVETGKPGEGDWLKQRYQLHVGTYLGTRDHIRAFAPSEGSRWTALQAHSEYWDWFRLRHTVTDVRGTADVLESEFKAVNETTVERRYTRDSGPFSRGIVVVATLVPLVVGHRRWARLRGRFEDPSRSARAGIVLTIALAAPLSIRGAGIALEQLVPLVNPKLFVALLYPFLAVGLPVAVARRGRDVPPWLAGSAAAVGLGVGFAVEFALLGVTPPDRLVGHRLLVATALGLLAAGGGRRRTGLTLVGVVVWLWGLFAPLLGAV